MDTASQPSVEAPPPLPVPAIAIETQDLVRQFGDKRAVDQLCLRVERGCFYGFLGPNGAGKSTTIKMLTGLLAPSSGRMRILGEDVSDPAVAREIKRRIGVVPENLGLFENLTAREYLSFIGRMYLIPRETIQTRSAELLQIMALDQEEKKLTLEYSHGMKKKLALAAALLPNPDLIFLDEPFEGVDAVSSRVLRDVLKRCVERGATIFLTSHVLEIVERLCTNVGIIAQGRLVLQQPMAEIRAQGSLEERFMTAVGREHAASQQLSWL
ncbi:MAG: ABC transporter ATP-binding protein [Verrucomicrobia bacterium]|nr:ABC transporter ATP-binding protein [Verrucomicrobiota bacterium]